MKKILNKTLILIAFLIVGNLNAQSATSQGEPVHRDDGFIYGTQNYPVTLCGGVAAATKGQSDDRLLFKNGPMVISLSLSALADPYAKQQFSDVRRVFPYSVQGCIHGRQLPVTTDGVTVFEVERTSLAISSGGFSVSN